MTIKLLNTGDQKNLQRFLSEYAETTLFIQSNLRDAGLTYDGKMYQGEYLASIKNPEKSMAF